MDDLAILTRRLAFVFGAGLALAGCGGNETATNTANLDNLDANAILEAPGNDASAMEAAVNAPEPVATTNAGEASNSTEVLGETEGGDTGGNTMGNRSGT
jgi:hypothetical protein